MSREIRFRAWDKENKTMYDWQTIRQYPIDYTFGSDIVTPMQYTGLYDPNGQPIYEGDVVSCTNGHIGIVKFGRYKDSDMSNHYKCGHLGFYIDLNDDFLRKDICYWHGTGMKVIGNVYENPELLQEVEK